jgi:hypothetical protein
VAILCNYRVKSRFDRSTAQKLQKKDRPEGKRIFAEKPKTLLGSATAIGTRGKPLATSKGKARIQERWPGFEFVPFDFHLLRSLWETLRMVIVFPAK